MARGRKSLDAERLPLLLDMAREQAKAPKLTADHLAQRVMRQSNPDDLRARYKCSAATLFDWLRRRWRVDEVRERCLQAISPKKPVPASSPRPLSIGHELALLNSKLAELKGLPNLMTGAGFGSTHYMTGHLQAAGLLGDSGVIDAARRAGLMGPGPEMTEAINRLLGTAKKPSGPAAD